MHIVDFKPVINTMDRMAGSTTVISQLNGYGRIYSYGRPP